MLTEISLKNFKCIADATIRAAPITLLAGLNGAGKSSLIQSLLLLRQSHITGELARGYLQTSGDLVDLGTASDVLYEGADNDSVEIAVRDSSMAGARAHFSFGISSQNFARAPDILQHQATLNFLSSTKTAALVLTPSFSPDASPKFHYLNAERVGPRKYGLMSTMRAGEFNLGTKGEFALHVLHENQGRVALADDDPRKIKNVSGRLADQVEAWLAGVSPGVRLDLLPVEQADLLVGTFSFAEQGELRSRQFRATNVGFGLSYVLPVLLAFLSCEAGGVILLENPEAHIHPAGQTRLGELCAFAAAAGVQIIVETHSDHFMDGVRIAVRNSILPATDCAFHYFTRAGTRSEIASPELDKTGRLSFWPSGFFDQHRRNTAKLVKPV